VPSGCFPLLEYMVLGILRERHPLCAYGVYRALRERGFQVNEGSVYRLLSKLRSEGLVEVVEVVDGRIRYGLTGRGLERLCELKRLLSSLLELGGEC